MYTRKQTRILKPGSFQAKRKKIKAYTDSQLQEFYKFLEVHNPYSKVFYHAQDQLISRGIL